MIAAYNLTPPYRDPEFITEPTAPAPTRGTVRMLRPTRDAAVDALVQAIRDIQGRLAYITIVLWLDLVPRERTVEMILAAGEHAVRGFVLTPVIDAAQLRMHIGETLHVGRDVAYRLDLLGFNLDRQTTTLIDAACVHGLHCRKLQDLLGKTGWDYDRLRRALSRAGLGSPAEVYQVLRLLLVAIVLQRDISTTVRDVASRFGYYDSAALRQRINDVFGASPFVVRQWLGWEPLLVVAVNRAGIRRRGKKGER